MRVRNSGSSRAPVTSVFSTVSNASAVTPSSARSVMRPLPAVPSVSCTPACTHRRIPGVTPGMGRLCVKSHVVSSARTRVRSPCV